MTTLVDMLKLVQDVAYWIPVSIALQEMALEVVQEMMQHQQYSANQMNI